MVLSTSIQVLSNPAPLTHPARGPRAAAWWTAWRPEPHRFYSKWRLGDDESGARRQHSKNDFSLLGMDAGVCNLANASAAFGRVQVGCETVLHAGADFNGEAEKESDRCAVELALLFTLNNDSVWLGSWDDYRESMNQVNVQ